MVRAAGPRRRGREQAVVFTGADPASRFQRRSSAASALFLILGTGTATDRSLKWRVFWMFTGVAALRQVLGQGGRRSRISHRELPGRIAKVVNGKPAVSA